MAAEERGGRSGTRSPTTSSRSNSPVNSARARPTPPQATPKSSGAENLSRPKNAPPRPAQFAKKPIKKKDPDVNELGVGPAKKVAARSVAQVLTGFGYKWIGPIAAGAFSMVARAQHIESGIEVAVKTFDAQKCATGKEQEEAERELNVLRLIAVGDHAHIANLLSEFESPVGKRASPLLKLYAVGSVAGLAH